MKLNTSFNTLFLVLFFSLGNTLDAQVTIGPDFLGINAASPQSSLSVNGDGDTRYGAYIKSISTANGAMGLFAETPIPGCPSCASTGLNGQVASGLGFTYGVRGISSSPTSSGAGRAYGVWGQAGNATEGYNYGVYGTLNGANKGTAVLGIDAVSNTSWNGLVDGYWAGYFVGDVEVDGKLAIGTTERPTSLSAPTFDLSTYKLFVCGGILAEEWLIPNQPWCDYVFDNDYQLMPLREVERHIATNGHLHNTPSAKEIESTGLEMGKITVNQQEKIEEIFLHLIDMNKRLSTLEQDNADLKKENALLKAQLETRQTSNK